MRYSGGGAISTIVSMKNTDKGNIAFVPLAMPLMCGPGAIATIIGMTSLIKHSEFEFFVFLAIACAILATMVMTIFAWRMQRIFWANWADGHRRRHSHRGVFRFRNWCWAHFSWDNRSVSGLRPACCALTIVFVSMRWTAVCPRGVYWTEHWMTFTDTVL